MDALSCMRACIKCELKTDCIWPSISRTRSATVVADQNIQVPLLSDQLDVHVDVINLNLDLSVCSAVPVQQKDIEMAAILTPFRPIVQEIVRNLTRLVALDSNHSGIHQTNSDMKEFRTDIYDMMRDVAFISGSVNLLSFIYKSMVEGEQKAWNQVR